ncbi:hypothetical protein [Enterococcus asini]|uniref:hypothetical protein n=1 Tax=Enterococcus asini TaxID=57732 RepID=UPI0022E41084|nr:hypothetical protein [Enterococcus asini]
MNLDEYSKLSKDIQAIVARIKELKKYKRTITYLNSIEFSSFQTKFREGSRFFIGDSTPIRIDEPLTDTIKTLIGVKLDELIAEAEKDLRATTKGMIAE